MLLVDDDEAQILYRSEDGGTGADDEALLSAAQAPPRIIALAQ